jgi:N-glycosidase YbiA
MAIYFYNQDYDLLNGFSANAVEVDGKLYPTVEHAYQAAKCTDLAGKEAIRQARSPLMAKQLANETYKAAKRPDWDDVKLEVMERLYRLKIAQHSEVKQALLATGDQAIHENSPVDYFWGCGKDGTGQKSHIGKLWMKIRAELRAET